MLFRSHTNDLLTPEAYELVVLSMSTGDYSTHEATVIVIPESDERSQEAIELSQDILESYE